MIKKILHSILYFSFFLSQAELNAQVLEDYSDKWVIGERESWFGSSDRISQAVDLNSFPLSYLYLEIPGETVVFAGEKLWFYAEQDTVWARQVDGIKQELKVDGVNLTLYKEGIGTQDVKFKKILDPKNVSIENQDSTGGLKIRQDKRGDLRDFFVVASLIILILIALYKQAYPYIFRGLSRPSGLLSDDDFSEIGSLQKFFSMDILSFVFLVNLMTSLVATIGFVIFRSDLLLRFLPEGFKYLLIFWLAGAFGLLILTIFKFLGIRIFAYMFDLGKVEFPHFFYLLRLIIWGSMIFLAIAFMFLMNSFFQLENVLELAFRGFFWMYLGGIGVLFLMMMNKLSFKKYHLFTYLCIAELVPFLILAKWVMVLGQ